MIDLDHKHIIVNAAVSDPPIKTDVAEDWLREIVKAAGMKLVIGPFAHYCTAEDNEGIAAVCCLETSHSSLHVWDKAEVPYIRFDLYSCSCFDVNKILEVIEKFDPYFYEWVLIDRNDNISKADSGEKQVSKIIDMLSKEERILYLEAEKIRGKGKRSNQHKSARSKYAKLRRLYSLDGSKYCRKRVLSHKSTMSCIKSRCKKKNIDYDLDVNWYEESIREANKKWPKIKEHPSNGDFWRAEVDRIDPSLGYTKNNCRIIPKALNVAKFNWNKHQMTELARLITEEVSSTTY